VNELSIGERALAIADITDVARRGRPVVIGPATPDGGARGRQAHHRDAALAVRPVARLAGAAGDLASSAHLAPSRPVTSTADRSPWRSTSPLPALDA
jgi:hypothetical protein